MHSKIATLENDNKELRKSLEQQKPSTTRLIGMVETKVYKTNNTLSALESNSKSEFKKIKTEFDRYKKDSRKEVVNVDTKISKAIKKLELLELNSADEFKKIREGRR